MKVEIAPYDKGQGLYIDGRWSYGIPYEGRKVDASTVAYIIALECSRRGFPVEYEFRDTPIQPSAL